MRADAILIISLILLVIGFSGCVDSNSNTYQLGNITFQLLDGWENPEEVNDVTTNLPGLSSSYQGQNELFLYLKLFPDESSFIEEYNTYSAVEGVTKKTLNVNGTMVKYLQRAIINPGNNQMGSRVTTDYYFTKNKGFYVVSFEDFRQDTSDQKVIEDTANLIINTLN